MESLMGLTKSLALGRRDLVRGASFASLGWLASRALAWADAKPQSPKRASESAGSLILLWLDGGPSQLETFDPHPDPPAGFPAAEFSRQVCGPTRAIRTTVPGIQLADGLPQLAERMRDITLIRSLASKEGDHERGRYYLKTGYRPIPAVAHPAVGAICAARLPDPGIEIPRYITILARDRFTRGGYLGEGYDALGTGDPNQPPGNMEPATSRDRFDRRLESLRRVEGTLAGLNPRLGERTQHMQQVDRALRMMSSEQLRAFRIEDEPARLRDAYGDSPFGRGCLAARRLVEAGVSCVEVHLSGWDTHVDNFEGHQQLCGILDPAFAALIADLRERRLWERVLVLCIGEFGRTPRINQADGRDHWPGGFSCALAGGWVRGGRVHGATDPAGKADPKDPVGVGDLYATVLAALGIDPTQEITTPIGRPIKLAEGQPLRHLLVE